MKLALIYNSSINSRGGTGEICQAILERSPQIELVHYNLRDIWSVKGGFDLYLRIDEGDYDAKFPDLHPYVWWASDTHIRYVFPKIVRAGAACDHLFCYQKEGARRVAEKLGREVHWLPAAVDHFDPPLVFVPYSERKWDIVFVGTTGKFSLRKVVLELIKSEYPNSFVGNAKYSELAQYYSQARVVVNYPIINDVNMRIFEAMGSGALLLNYRIINNGFEDLFKIGEHCEVFSDVTTSNLKDMIDACLASPQKSEAIARKGFELVNARHTYKNRMEEILKVAGFPIKL
jgi:hypothetical protein